MTNINLSFYKHNLEYSQRATELELECERIGRILIDNADGNIPKIHLIVVFYLPLHPSFRRINRKVIWCSYRYRYYKKEEMLTPGTITNPSPKVIEQVNTVNESTKSTYEICCFGNRNFTKAKIQYFIF